MPAEETPARTDERSRSSGRWPKRVTIGLAVALVILVVAPLLWPVPPLDDTVPVYDLAYPDSRWIDLSGVDVHYQESGEETCAVLLLHGFGASTFSWRDIRPDLSVRCTTVAYDRPGFGLTQRPMPGDWKGTSNNPYGLTYQSDQVIELMDALGIERAVLVGHSAGAAVAVLAATRHPDRIDGLALESPAVLSAGGPPPWLLPILRTPQMRHLGPLVSRSLGAGAGQQILRDSFYDPSLVTPQVEAGYERPLRADDWDRALWEFTIAPRPDHPADALPLIEVPVLVIAGENDAIVAPADSREVARRIEGARFVAFDQTGHLPHEERPERFLTEVYRYLDDLAESCDECN